MSIIYNRIWFKKVINKICWIRFIISEILIQYLVLNSWMFECNSTTFLVILENLWTKSKDQGGSIWFFWLLAHHYISWCTLINIGTSNSYKNFCIWPNRGLFQVIVSPKNIVWTLSAIKEHTYLPFFKKYLLLSWEAQAYYTFSTMNFNSLTTGLT